MFPALFLLFTCAPGAPARIPEFIIARDAPNCASDRLVPESPELPITAATTNESVIFFQIRIQMSQNCKDSYK